MRRFQEKKQRNSFNKNIPNLWTSLFLSTPNKNDNKQNQPWFFCQILLQSLFEDSNIFRGDANISLFFWGWSLTLELLRFRRVASFNPLPHPKKHAADGSRNPVNSPVEGNASFILSFFDKVSTKHPRWLFSRISEPSRSSSSNYRRWIGDY